MPNNQNQRINIPKIIHYVWLGKGEKSKKINDCIDSWRVFCPDYQLIEWNEDRIKDISNPFLTEAIQHKYWAFASDYLRLYALYNYGGLYFDTDLEITAPLDRFLFHNFFCSFEIGGNYPSTALLGARKHDNLILELLDHYENRRFIINDKPDLTPNPKIFRKILSQHNPDILEANEQSTVFLDEGRILYPSHFFCKPEAQLENYAIHHFEGSWLSEKTRKRLHNTTNKTIFKIFRIEIRKSISGPFAPYPPTFNDTTKTILTFEYKKRRRIYILLTKE